MSLTQSVLVTGASKGIGRAIALASAKAGYKIVVHYGKDQVGAEETLQQIKQGGGEGRLISFDVAHRQSCRTILEADIAEYGAYYGVVLNAGIARDNAFPSLEDEEWDQ
ncbi:MAG TPA: SDR family NAD(P)-dependent oxidoreductase, partial [Alphaproteobacteria bacterium]|nr:SDR family NAD(P)-dependent oxidoreductase [Alphaproteobacteria bacterium]